MKRYGKKTPRVVRRRNLPRQHPRHRVTTVVRLVGGGAVVDTGGDRDSWPRNWGSGIESNPAPASTHGGGCGLERSGEWPSSKLKGVEK